jgi:hypothetical protein
MKLKPLEWMWQRVDRAREDSDTALFHDLVYGCEMVLKLVVAGLVGAIAEERDRHRYRHLYRLVRAVGLRDWSMTADLILTGPAAQHLSPATQAEQRQLTQRCGRDTWQYESVRLLHESLAALEPDVEPLPDRVDGRRWLELFGRLRNRRAHDAPPPGLCSRVCQGLEASLRLICENYESFQRPWVSLRRNLNGKYTASRLSVEPREFDPLKPLKMLHWPDGVYVYLDRPVHLELLHCGAEANDLFIVNGGFSEKQFELLSYLTNAKVTSDSRPFLTPPTELPDSETQPAGALAVQGNCYANLPPARADYVHRPALEERLFDRLIEDNHPVITLAGRGGIGKTSLALRVLHRVADGDRFDFIVWFSGRDIDLLAGGPKPVRPQALSEQEVASAFAGLIGQLLSQPPCKPKEALAHLTDAMSKGTYGPTLFVFDNFETMRRPAELFAWIDAYIRPPSKVLITTRFRDFRGDYPVEVLGMEEPECEELMDNHARRLKIQNLVSRSYKRQVYHESEGHPYIVKVLLGEVAKLGRVEKVERVVAGRDDILAALFERSYARLTPGAQRVFLTLCAWPGTAAQLAVEAVLVRPENEAMDIRAAIDELIRTSLIEHQEEGSPPAAFLSAPLSAAVFGRRKLMASPWKAAVQADLQVLQAFGVSRKAEMPQGVAPRVERLYRHLSGELALGRARLDTYLPILEYVATHYPPAWLMLADLWEEADRERGAEQAAGALRRYVEAQSTEGADPRTWKRLADLCRRCGDRRGEMTALVEMCRAPDAELALLRATAERLDEYARQSTGSPWAAEESACWTQQLAEQMAPRMAGAGAADCASLAKLYWRLGDRRNAWDCLEKGMALEPGNSQCQKVKGLMPELAALPRTGTVS